MDNTSALYGLVKGYSRVPMSSSIIAAVHTAALRYDLQLWFNYVASKANIADLPSRGALAEMAALLSRFQPSFSLAEAEVPVVLPDLGGGWGAVLEAVRSLREQPRSRRGGRRRRR